jgi:hypothetical protein
MIGFGQQTYVPDDNFEAFLEAHGMGDGIMLNDSVLTGNIDTVTTLNVEWSYIADLTGIEDFDSLQALSCSGNPLTILDVSTNLALTSLICHHNQLTSLDVSQNLALTYLFCIFNQLTTLDLSANLALTQLYCDFNQLTTLDLSTNLALTQLYCDYNQLIILDVSTNLALISLDCDYNQLTNLDVSQNTALTTLWCESNQLTSLDASYNTALTSLRCSNNQLTSLDVRNGNNTNMNNFYTINNPNLFCIDVDDVVYSNINWTVANGYGYGISSWNNFSSNCQNEIYGCTDPTSPNFDPFATIENGSCNCVYGCINILACNYNSIATCDDGSCLTVYGCTDSLACNYNPTATCDYGSCLTTYGCMDATACNYDTAAICDDGSCYGFLGCTDSLACNFDSLATCDDGYCILQDGCTDNLACNYNSLAICDDGSCLTTYGCMDATSCNYDTAATCDDGSCLTVYGCTDSLACNYNPTATCDYGSCIGLLGCVDSLAVNYNPGATCDNGTCVMTCDLSYSIISSSGISFSSCNGWLSASMIQTSYLPVTYLWSTGLTQPYIISLCYGLYTLTVTDAVGCTIDTAITIGQALIYGCTGPSYCNYDSLATADDGSCSGMFGCMDPLYVEYNSFASCDDGSCLTLINNSCTNPSPTNAYVNELIHDRARVNWDNMNDADCMVEQYRIRYREAGTSTWSSKTMSGSGLCVFGLNTTSKKILGLTPSTTYEYYMKAWYCGGGVSSWSSMQNFTTADECQGVINFAVSTPTTTKASFTWDTTAAYSFARIKLRPDTTGAVWTTAGGFGVFYPALSKSKNGLTPGQAYRASARTWCDPTGGAYRSATWTAPIFWTQPTTIKLVGESLIKNLFIYPNPSRDIFNVSFTSDTKQDLRVRILNVIGEELINDNLEQFIGEYTKQINLSDNPKGIYFLEIETNDGIINKKLILQ